MPYQSVSEVPDYVPKDKRKQWMEVWNSAHKKALADGKSDKEAEQSAFAQANAVAGPHGKDTKKVSAFEKFVKLAKVDETTHEVWGLVASEKPDADKEIADYEACKKAFQEWSDSFVRKTTAAGQEVSLGNIRLQHTLQIAGKAVKIEYRDADKEIWLGTKPVNDEVWNLVKGGYVTGYSMGGGYAWKKPDGSYIRFGPVISEVSYVDNPCNDEATFAYIKADGGIEMRKFQGSIPKGAEVAVLDEEKVAEIVSRQVAPLRKQLSNLIIINHECDEHCFCAADAELAKEAKTKRKAGKDLHASDFAYVGDPEDISTWKLPIHDAAHVRNALARFNQTQGIPAGEKAKVRAKIVAAAKKYGIEVSEKMASAIIAKAGLQIDGKFVKKMVAVANVTGEGLSKGMYAVAQMADMLEDLYFLCLSTTYEAEREGDNSTIPDELRSSLKTLADIFVSYAEEEAEEITSAASGKGALYMANEGTDLKKAELEKARKSVHDMLDGLHKASHAYHDKMIGLHKKAKELHKAHHDAMIAHHDKMHKEHEDRKEEVTDTIEKLKKAIGVSGSESEGIMNADGAVGAGPHAGSAHEGKAADAGELKKAQESLASLQAATEKQATDHQKAVEEMTKSIKTLTDKLEAMEKAQKDQLEETKAKQTLVGRDGEELKKTAGGSDVMSDTGL